MTTDPSAPGSHSAARLSPDWQRESTRPHGRGDSRPVVQFGVRSLLIAMSAAAVLLAIGTTIGGETVTNAIVAIFVSAGMVLTPVCFASLALYCCGQRRTYFMGAFLGFILTYFGGIGPMWTRSAFGAVGYLVIVFATAFLSGYIAVLSRQFAERRGWNLPTEKDALPGKSPSAK